LVVNFPRSKLQTLGVLTMTEHRKTQRRRVLKAGTISINRTAGIDCTVRNLSNAGACLDVASPLGIPDDFELVIGEDHSQQPCHVVWRSDKRIGIAFG
jgi:hypothetical protein